MHRDASPFRARSMCYQNVIPMKTSFLEYYKLILDNVSFDQRLFMKEYRKALNVLTEQEAFDLQLWLSTKGLPAGLPKACCKASTGAVSARPALVKTSGTGR